VTERRAAARPAAPARSGGGETELAAAWLALQRRIAGQSAHEVKNALNGLAVNVEVVRARAARGASADQIASFADSAAAQLEGVVALVEALLALARPARAAAEAGGVAGAFRALAPLVAASGREVEVVAESTVAQATQLDGELLRLVAAAALVAVAEAVPADAPGAVACRVEPDRDGVVRVQVSGAGPVGLPPDVARLAARAGVTHAPRADGIELTFPAAETR